LLMSETGILSSDALVEVTEEAICVERTVARSERDPRVAQIAAGVLSRIANSVAATQPNPVSIAQGPSSSRP
jgi:hypothetical protein